MSRVGYIYKIEKNKAIVLSPQDGFVTIKKPKNAILGQKVQYGEEDFYKPKNKFAYISVAAGIASVVLIVLFVYFQVLFKSNEVYGYFDADMNSSIEFMVDKDYKVINAVPLSDSAKKIINKIDPKGKSVEVVMKKYISLNKRVANNGEKNNNMIISACLDEKIARSGNVNEEESKLANALTKISKNIESANNGLTVQNFKLSWNERKRAMKLELSMGKYCIYMKSKKLDADIEMENIQNMTMKDIMDEVSTKIDDSKFLQGTINTNTTYQTIEGMGGSIAYYANWLTSHPNKTEIYKYIFKDLGINTLRIGNEHKANGINSDLNSVEIVKEGKKQLDNNLKVLMTSWSPPVFLKNNNNAVGGTLKKQYGAYVYDQYARYWYDSLCAYNTIGINPDYISIQNQPDASGQKYTSCMFDPVEGVNAGYAQALNAVYNKISMLRKPPKLIAPETMGMNCVAKYMSALDMNKLFGIGFHIYSDGNESNPDSYNKAFSSIANTYPGKMKIQTENDAKDSFQMAWTMHNALTHGDINLYLYYGLIWNGENPLIVLENPWQRGKWKTKGGYIVTDKYYVFKQFSKFIKSGYQRVDTNIESNSVKISAYISPDKKSITAVILNTSGNEESLKLNLNGFKVTNSEIYRTGGNDKANFIGSLNENNSLEIPGKSVVTVVIN